MSKRYETNELDEGSTYIYEVDTEAGSRVPFAAAFSVDSAALVRDVLNTFGEEFEYVSGEWKRRNPEDFGRSFESREQVEFPLPAPFTGNPFPRDLPRALHQNATATGPGTVIRQAGRDLNA